MTSSFKEVALYSIGAAAAFAADVSTLWMLVEICGIHYIFAATISFLVGTCVVYWVSIRYAFAFRRLADRRLELCIFTLIGIAGIALNVGLIYVLVEHVHAHYLAAKVVASGATFLTNLALRRTALFTRRQQAPSQPDPTSGRQCPGA